MVVVQTTEEDCLEALGLAAEKLGGSPTKAQYEELGLRPASATIIRVMGGWNEAKKEAGLKVNPSTGSRTKPKPNDVDIPDDAVWENLSVDQRWHYKNVEWNTERTLRRRGRLRSWINERKKVNGCTRCGLEDPSCLDYHHPDDADKEMAIGTLITYGYGKERLREEISECVVICANCHRLEHNRNWAKYGKEPENDVDKPLGKDFKSDLNRPRDKRERLQEWIYQIKRKTCGCIRCGEENPICLDFHHKSDKKTRTIASMVSNGCSKGEIRSEIRKCSILCANCHRKEHFKPPYCPD